MAKRSSVVVLILALAVSAAVLGENVYLRMQVSATREPGSPANTNKSTSAVMSVGGLGTTTLPTSSTIAAEPQQNSAPPPANISRIDLSAEGSEGLLVQDAEGRRTGMDPLTGTSFREIPQSSYTQESISDGESGQSATGVTQSIQIFQPAEGIYSIVLTAGADGTYDVSVQPYRSDGSAESALEATGSVTSGAEINLQLHFSSTPRDNSAIAPLPSST